MVLQPFRLVAAGDVNMAVISATMIYMLLKQEFDSICLQVCSSPVCSAF